MSKFNVGDRVVRIHGEHFGMNVGDVGTVSEVFGDMNLTLKEWKGGHMPQNLSLVDDPHLPSEPSPPLQHVLPQVSEERKTYPLMSGLFDYFESALCAVAHHSYEGNEKHNPGEPLHWSRGKSDDHLDAAMRHLVERDLTGAAWRVLAALQMELESQGYPKPRGAR